MKTVILSLTILLFGAGSCGKLRGEPLKKPSAEADSKLLTVSYHLLATIIA